MKAIANDSSWDLVLLAIILSGDRVKTWSPMKMFGRLKNPGRLTNKRSSKFFGVCSFGRAILRYILVSIKTPFLLYYPTL